MRAVVLEDGELRMERSYPRPEPGIGEALIRIEWAGICGTDRELLKGYMAFSGIPGHEFVGIVEESASRELIGRRVVGAINIGCNRCAFCRSGLSRDCPNRRVLGILNHDGVFADYIVLPVENLVAVPDDIPARRAIWTEPLAAALEIRDQLDVRSDDRVLVLGDGPLGILCAGTLSRFCDDVTLMGHHPFKLETAGKVFPKVNVREESGVEPVRTYDVVVDATGNPQGVESACRWVKPRGTVVLKTTCGPDRSVPFNDIVVNEITILGSRCGRMAPALAFLNRNEPDLDRMVTEVYPLEAYREAFREAFGPRSLKVLFSMEG